LPPAYRSSGERGESGAHKLSCLLALFLLTVIGGKSVAPAQAQPSQPTKRFATVADSISMIRLRFPQTTEGGPPATRSPDGERFAVLTYQGDLETNTNKASLLLFNKVDAFREPRPRLLLAWASESNNPAISDVHWLADNRTIVFLGEQPGNVRQIYSLDTEVLTVKQLTQHRTEIMAFDVTSDLRTIVYLARQPLDSILVLDETSKASGLLITDQSQEELTMGHKDENPWVSPLELFVQKDGNVPRRITFLHPDVLIYNEGIFLSRNGRFAVVWTSDYLYSSPESWREYNTPYGSNRTTANIYKVIDTSTGSVRPLVDAPTYCFRCVAWSADGRSVVLGGTFLPLDTDSTPERASRRSTEWAVEVNIESGAFTKIAQGRYDVLKWDSQTGTLFMKRQDTAWVKQDDKRVAIAFHNSGDQWHEINPKTANTPLFHNLEVVEDQDITTPPRLFFVNQKSGQKTLLLDLNPQFQAIKFGHVERITFHTTDGREIGTGLYEPPDYVPGLKYPLVIQTHGWNPDEFSIDGLSGFGYAAQALAAKDIIVAQLPLVEYEQLGTPIEGPHNVAMFEGLIDDLDRRGLIDRNRVGLQAWSRTGYHVRSMLVFSRYPIAAAVIADGMDGGYMQYLAGANVMRGGPSSYEGIYGGPPYGQGLYSWFKNAPSFNLDKVHTPVRELESAEEGRVCCETSWEWFVGLKRLGKPVELLWLPDALHEPAKPLERMTAQQGNVDWFDFWLNNHEDSDPAKAKQYGRWRELRKLQNSNQAASK
jgi:dipeptidyl aminopeptidase/acylaminoacyl peptidase